MLPSPYSVNKDLRPQRCEESRNAQVWPTGAAYYYYASRDAIVLDFYQRSCEEMQEKLRLALSTVTGLEDGLRDLIHVKLTPPTFRTEPRCAPGSSPEWC